MDIKVKELTETIQNIDKDITEQYNKSRTTKGVVSTTAKQRACMLLKKKKMYIYSNYSKGMNNNWDNYLTINSLWIRLLLQKKI